MSRENVEAAGRLYKLYERGDIEGMLARMHPDLEVDLTERLFDEGILRGRDAYRAFLQRTFGIWAEFRFEVEELLDAGDAVVALVRTVGVGRESRIEVEERNAHVAWMRNGTMYRVKVFAERERALEAAGLSE
jgi:ketosteroid isomerase-like protein